MSDGQERILDLDEVARLIQAHGETAYVEQTGGGCATILVGSHDDDGYYEVSAGPGWFAGPGWVDPRGDTADFYVGRDDSGEAPATKVPEDADEAAVAQLVIQELVKARKDEGPRTVCSKCLGHIQPDPDTASGEAGHLWPHK